MMQDLRKVEEKFHEYLKESLDEKIYRIDELKITEKLLEKQEAFLHTPDGYPIFWQLKMESLWYAPMHAQEWI